MEIFYRIKKVAGEWVGGWMSGWVGGQQMEEKAVSRNAYSKKKFSCKCTLINKFTFDVICKANKSK